MTRRAAVWHHQRRVGELWEESSRLQFCYDEAWLDDGFPVSQTLPLSLATRPVDAHAFFAGLLPEGLARQRICRQRRIPETDDVALLWELGRDCAGALSVVPEGATPTEPEDDAEPVTLDAAAMRQLVVSHGQSAYVAAGQRQRFSLAGAQDKLAVVYRDGTYYLPNRRHPSSHILKFETITKVCLAELAATDLARRVGLETVVIEHQVLAEKPWLRIARYDRLERPSGLQRLHQEDMLQAMGRDPSNKYQEEGGPTLGDVANLVRRVTAEPARDITRLRDWQLFNYLVGNFDGHAKNLALVYPAGAAVPRVAPFYDLVAIEFLNALGIGDYDRRMAFFIGAHALPERITVNDWRTWAKDMGLPARSVLERLDAMATDLPRLAEQTTHWLNERLGANPVHERFAHTVAKRCRALRGQIARSS